MKNKLLQEARIFVVVPYYNASAQISEVIRKLPEFIDTVVIVDDQSPQKLPMDAIEALKPSHLKIICLENPMNLGVGGATITGIKHCIANQADIIIKMDADDQMDPKYLPDLINPLLEGRAEMAKGNRFRDIKALKSMPLGRRIGNLGLSFLTKMATGYWNNFDPNNGYLAIRSETLQMVDLSKLSPRYFFETSLIAQLYFIRARILDVSMPAIYAGEVSSMKVWTMPLVFSGRLIKVFLKRILKEYFLYDFNIASLYLLTGGPLFLFGVVFGIVEWIHYNAINAFAPTGTIMVVALSIILGFQLLLQAIQYDIFHAPKPK